MSCSRSSGSEWRTCLCLNYSVVQQLLHAVFYLVVSAAPCSPEPEPLMWLNHVGAAAPARHRHHGNNTKLRAYIKENKANRSETGELMLVSSDPGSASFTPQSARNRTSQTQSCRWMTGQRTWWSHQGHCRRNLFTSWCFSANWYFTIKALLRKLNGLLKRLEELWTLQKHSAIW